MGSIIYHNDLDGKCAGAIALRANPGFRCFKAQYDRELDFDDLRAPVIMVDFSFPPDRFRELRDRFQDITWIDHHQRTIEKLGAQADLPGLRSDTKPAACLLTWEYFFPEEEVPLAVELAHLYDTWLHVDHPDQERVLSFQEGIMMYNYDPGSEIWACLLQSGTGRLDEIVEKGRFIREYQAKIHNEWCNTWAYEAEFEGRRILACCCPVFTSLFYGERIKKYPFVAVYLHDGHKFKVSLYSEGKVDVSEIADRFGGGGHREAAGFTTDMLPFHPVE